MTLGKCTLGFRGGPTSLYVIIIYIKLTAVANHEILSSYIVLDQLRLSSLLELGFRGIIERLYLRLPMSHSELGFSRDA